MSLLVPTLHSSVVVDYTYRKTQRSICLNEKIQVWTGPMKMRLSLSVSENSAVFGGGVYIADNSTVGDLQCQGAENQPIDDNLSATKECFIQILKLYTPSTHKESSRKYTYSLSNNTAEFGSALYGGLLDRCTVNPLAEAYDEVRNGLQYIKKTGKRFQTTQQSPQILYK